MTPQEKADELHVGYWRLTNDSRIAKQCAIIAVDEIINSVVVTNLSVAENQFLYWEQVKQEIEKL
jgi:hypothetical protein